MFLLSNQNTVHVFFKLQLENLMRNSMRSVGNVVRTMPDNLLNTVDEVMDNITKVFVNEDNPQVNFDSTGAIDLEVEIFLEEA